MIPILSTPDQRFVFRVLCVFYFVLVCFWLFSHRRLRGRAGGAQ